MRSGVLRKLQEDLKGKKIDIFLILFLCCERIGYSTKSKSRAIKNLISVPIRVIQNDVIYLVRLEMKTTIVTAEKCGTTSRPTVMSNIIDYI